MEAKYQLQRPATFKKRKRVGTGPSAGQGKTCGRGMNGQMCRSGAKRRAWFEGGQMPLQRRVPKRGFNNHFRKEYQVVNISSISKLKESEITPEILMKHNLIDSDKKLIKVLSLGDISAAKKITVDAYSKSALDKIKKAGGELIIREHPTKMKKAEQGK